MNNWEKDFMNELKAKRTTYADMIDFCSDSMVMNNDLMNALSDKGFYFDVYCGTDYDDEEDYYYEVYQTFIIGEQDAERFARYTNELVYYCEDLNLYMLGVCHWGTIWSGVPANWKDFDEDDED